MPPKKIEVHLIPTNCLGGKSGTVPIFFRVTVYIPLYYFSIFSIREANSYCKIMIDGYKWNLPLFFLGVLYIGAMESNIYKNGRVREARHPTAVANNMCEAGQLNTIALPVALFLEAHSSKPSQNNSRSAMYLDDDGSPRDCSFKDLRCFWPQNKRFF